MRKSIRRIVCMTAVILVVFSLVPAPARAVDPVSAATMANALAQAITAYGASQGVSMMYDVTDTNGIGEGVHDLWDQFKTDINDNDVPTYDSLAVTTWSTIYKKVGNSVAINLSDTVVSYLDRFWNWLLSGPAEMTKVDDQYYEWSVVDGNVSPINVYDDSRIFFNGVEVHVLPRDITGSVNVIQSVVSGIAYSLIYRSSSSTVFVFSVSDSAFTDSFQLNSGGHIGGGQSQLSAGGWSYNRLQLNATTDQQAADVTGELTNPGIDAILGDYVSGSVIEYNNGISVRPYVGAETPENVYMPDNDDVNYQPLPYVGPLSYPWQNAWGDGETVTDAIGTSIAGSLDDAIVDDGTLQLEGDNTVNPPIDDVIGGPDDYQVPGLADVFPFCIPFDIYNFLSALAADPVAPHFSAEMDFPDAIGGTQTIDIDFDSPTWNQLAQLLRLLELLAFIVGLALLTRSMFIRG